jgi:hypothetical protein
MAVRADVICLADVALRYVDTGNAPPQRFRKSP